MDSEQWTVVSKQWWVDSEQWTGYSLEAANVESDGAEEAGGDGLEVVHVLGVEAVAEAGAEGGQVARELAGEEIDGGVIDVDF
jgi:hypothetical protein